MLRVLDEHILFKNTKVGDSFRPENAAFFLIYNGTIALEINGKQFLFQKGSIIILSSKNLYKVIHISEDLKAFILSDHRDNISRNTNININRYDAYRIANDEFKSNALSYDDKELHYLIHQFTQLKDHFDSTNYLQFKHEIIWNIISIIIYGVLGKMISNFRNSTTPNTRKEELTLEFIRLVSEYFKEEKELKFYADRLHISIKYLSNTVKEITNIPPSNFISDALLNEAKILLLNKEKTIKDIANILGFADQYSFGKFFKKHSGLSPKHYKQENVLVNSF